ncbi:MAG: hypothetical protein RJA92_233, partial [Bacteroidota bacterium]
IATSKKEKTKLDKIENLIAFFMILKLVYELNPNIIII